MHLNTTAPARFASKVDRTTTPDGCWPWTGFRDRDGYGRMRPGGQGQPDVGAHRVAWVLEHGPIPDGHMVLHRCDNPPCVRASHLFLGDAADNAHDRDGKGRTGSTKGRPRGPWKDDHARRLQPERSARGARNGNARFTEDDVRAMRAAFAGGESQGSIARRFGTAQPVVSSIVRRTAWAHVE